MIEEWAEALGISAKVIYVIIALLLLVIVINVNKTAGLTLGGLAIIGILTADRKNDKK